VYTVYPYGNSGRQRANHSPVSLTTVQEFRRNNRLWYTVQCGNNITTEIAAYDRHSIGSQSSCLVRTDRCRVAHRLTSVQVSHQVIIFHHSLQATHAQRQRSTLRVTGDVRKLTL